MKRQFIFFRRVYLIFSDSVQIRFYFIFELIILLRDARDIVFIYSVGE